LLICSGCIFNGYYECQQCKQEWQLFCPECIATTGHFHTLVFKYYKSEEELLSFSSQASAFSNSQKLLLHQEPLHQELLHQELPHQELLNETSSDFLKIGDWLDQTPLVPPDIYSQEISLEDAKRRIRSIMELEPSQVIGSWKGYNFTPEIMLRLIGPGWLTDELINSYLEILGVEQDLPEKKMLIFSCYFINILKERGIDGIAKWKQLQGVM
jgi:Ulp1 family protease